MNTIYNEDCLETLQKLKDKSVDLVLTSPPYDNMRQYGGNKTYHQRLNNVGYSFAFEDIAQELTRVLQTGGVIFWNVADQTIKGSRTGNSMRQALYFMDECGLNLWDHIIWQKTGTPFPNNVRYRNVWENCFVFSKGKPKTFNPIKVKNKTAGAVRYSRRFRNHQGTFVDSMNGVEIKNERNMDNVWLISNGANKSYKGNLQITDHPAIMTEELARRAIVSYTNKNDVVYDPFMGSGTTCRIARDLGRKWIGSEIHTPYFKIADQLLNHNVFTWETNDGNN